MRSGQIGGNSIPDLGLGSLRVGVLHLRLRNLLLLNLLLPKSSNLQPKVNTTVSKHAIKVRRQASRSLALMSNAVLSASLVVVSISRSSRCAWITACRWARSCSQLATALSIITARLLDLHACKQEDQCACMQAGMRRDQRIPADRIQGALARQTPSCLHASNKKTKSGPCVFDASQLEVGISAGDWRLGGTVP